MSKIQKSELYREQNNTQFLVSISEEDQQNICGGADTNGDKPFEPICPFPDGCDDITAGDTDGGDDGGTGGQTEGRIFSLTPLFRI